MKYRWRAKGPLRIGLLISILSIPLGLQAQKNDVMGKLQFEGRTKVEKDSGVWVDGQYVGYMKELKGSKTVLLLPGEHQIAVRQDGYQDFAESVQIQPRQTKVIVVLMQKARMGALPPVLATVKVAVNPSRAAVFVDGLYVGHVSEFEGIGHGLLVAPGTHEIKIALAGYETFQTEIKPAARQKVELKTDLLKSDNPLTAPLVKTGASATTSPSAARETTSAESH